MIAISSIDFLGTDIMHSQKKEKKNQKTNTKMMKTVELFAHARLRFPFESQRGRRLDERYL